MTLYDWLLLGHILAAITWVGGAIMIHILGTRLERAQGVVIGEFVRQTAWLGKGLFPAASIAVLGFGVAMVAVNDAWTIGQLWIILALVGIGLTVLTGVTFFAPESARLAKAIEERGPDHPDVRRGFRRITAVSRVDLAILVLIVADMILKPGL